MNEHTVERSKKILKETIKNRISKRAGETKVYGSIPSLAAKMLKLNIKELWIVSD